MFLTGENYLFAYFSSGFLDNNSNQLPDFYSSYIDHGDTDIVPGSYDGQLSGSTGTILVPSPPAGYSRQVKYLSINMNVPTGLSTGYIAKSSYITPTGILLQSNFNTGYSLQYTFKNGFNLYDQYGNDVQSNTDIVISDYYSYIFSADPTGSATGIATNVVAGLVGGVSFSSSTAITSGTYYCVPFYSPPYNNPVLNRIGVYVASTGVPDPTGAGGVAGENTYKSIGIGVYTNLLNPGCLYPDKLVTGRTVTGRQCGTGATGIVFTGYTVLSPNTLYWAVVTHYCTGSASHSFRQMIASGCNATVGLGSPAISSTTPTFGYTTSYTGYVIGTQLMPNKFIPWTASTWAASLTLPAIYLRFS